MTKLLTKKQMEALTTKRLLAYKNKLMQVPETGNWDCGKCAGFAKDHELWKMAMANLKEVLATREHVA